LKTKAKTLAGLDQPERFPWLGISPSEVKQIGSPGKALSNQRIGINVLDGVASTV